MNRAYYWMISAFAIIAIAVTLGFYYTCINSFNNNEHNTYGLKTTEQPKKEQVLNNNSKTKKPDVPFMYFILEKDGYLIIYESDKVTEYETISIDIEKLPKQEQENLKNGIKVRDKDALYSILESYSS